MVIWLDNFEAGIAVVDWAELNKIHSRSETCLKYLGNHFGNDFDVYVVFAGVGVFKAVKI